MDINILITIDRDILGGQPVFTGMRVPIESLFDHLEAGFRWTSFWTAFLPSPERKRLAYLVLQNNLSIY